MIFPPAVSGAGAAYEIEKSLRFRASASAYLSRTPGVAGNRRTWTWSGWVKRGALTEQRCLFTNEVISTVSEYVVFSAANEIEVGFSPSGGAATLYRRSTALFRDPSAHYNIVVAVDTPNATAQNRIRVYVNNTEITSWSVNVAVTQNQDTFFNTTNRHCLGAVAASSSLGTSPFDGYLSEINFVDGQALDPTSFGEFDANGVWVPKRYTGTYGTNGFHLPFSDGTSLSTLTADASGNGNNWTANNISLTAGATYDWMDDTPTNNFPVLNPLYTRSTSTASAANLNFTTAAALSSEMAGTIQIPETGKWYWECVATAMSSSRAIFGVGRLYAGTTYSAETAFGISIYSNAGEIITNNTVVQTVGAFGVNDVIGIAVNKDSGEVSFYKNGTLLTTRAFSATELFPLLNDADNITSVSGHINFGQRPFAYTPPTGYQKLCTANLPAPTIAKPSDHFDVKLYVGNSGTQSITGLNFQPDLVWMKSRGRAVDHAWYDSVRGVQKQLESNNTGAETTEATGLTAFNADGWTMGALDQINSTTSTNAYVAWAWKANGAAVTNTAGTITSQVSANTTAGFSIVTYTGNGGTNVSVGHGLGVVPKVTIVKRRTGGTGDWVFYTTVIDGSQDFLSLNSTNAKGDAGSSAATSSLFYLGGSASDNASGSTYVAYCFAEVPGFSKIGSYTGNGSADGPFVYCGFKPKWVLWKRTGTAGGNWMMLDGTREPENVLDLQLYPNLSNAETGGTAIDFTANGFKIRTADGTVNNNELNIFLAFAETPFNYSRAR